MLIYYFELKKAAFWFNDFQQPSLGDIQMPKERRFKVLRAVPVAMKVELVTVMISSENSKLESP